MGFAELLTARLAELTLTQADLARHLTTNGIPTTKQSVHAWASGETRPEGWKRHAIYDYLGLTRTERATWTEALLEKRDGSPKDLA